MVCDICIFFTIEKMAGSVLIWNCSAPTKARESWKIVFLAQVNSMCTTFHHSHQFAAYLCIPCYKTRIDTRRQSAMRFSTLSILLIIYAVSIQFGKEKQLNLNRCIKVSIVLVEGRRKNWHKGNIIFCINNSSMLSLNK